MKYLISIIIPVYNTDKVLLKSCLDSVLNQTYTNIEVLIVDDGSCEEIGLYCDEIAKKDDRVIVIHQNNQGVSAARNNGTRASQGDYVMYVDSDDLLAPIAVEEGVKYILQERVDVVISGMERLESHGDFSYMKEMSNKYEVLTPEKYDILKRHLLAIDNSKYLRIKDRGYITRGPVCRLIRKDVVLSLFFLTDIPIGEDLIWNMELLKYSRSVCIVYNIWYGYLKMPESAIRKYYGDRIEKTEMYLTILKNNNRTFCEQNKDVYGKNVAVEFYCILRYELLSNKCRLSSNEKNKIVQAMLKRNPWNDIFDHETIRYLPYKYKMLIIVCRINIWQTIMKLFFGRK